MTSTTYITLSKPELDAIVSEAAIKSAATALVMAGVYVNQTQAAEARGVNRRTIGEWIKAGKLRTRGTKVLAGDVLEMGK